MEILKAILLGFLQGVTEFLPISSSGHLSVFQHFFGNVGGTSSLLFTVLLHMGTLIAVFVVYYKTIWGLIVEFFSTIKDIFTGKFKWSEMNENRRMLFMFVISAVLPMTMIYWSRESASSSPQLSFLSAHGAQRRSKLVPR